MSTRPFLFKHHTIDQLDTGLIQVDLMLKTISEQGFPSYLQINLRYREEVTRRIFLKHGPSKRNR